jgi:hypothetical protein
MTKKITISKSDLLKNKIKDFGPREHRPYWWTLDTEGYKFYSYLSKMVPNTTIIDVGTWDGASAYAFADEETNKVITYDIVRKPAQETIVKSNIELRIMDFIEDDSINYDEVSIVMIDVDPHDGIQEPPMIKHLLKNNWEGILVMDDISFELFPVLASYWKSLKFPKFNLADVAHFTGTGVACIGNKYSLELVD